MIYFISVVIVGTVLRIFSLSQHDFWFDEAFSYHIARLPVKDLIAVTLTDNNPPIYYLLLHYILKISDNEIVLRLPSLILGILAIPLVYIALKEQINKKAAIIAASLFSVSPLAIYTAAEARPHGPAVIFTLLISMAFFTLIKKPNIKYGTVFIFLAILGIYFHFYTLLLFLPFTWMVLFGKSRIKILKWLLILAIILSALLPWFFISIQNTHSDCACPSTILSLPASLISPAIGGVGSVTLRLFPFLPFPSYLILFAATSLLTLFLFVKGLNKHLSIIPVYILPLIILSLLGLFLPVFSPKAFSLFSPFYFGIVARGIYFLKKPILALILFILLSLISLIQIINPFFAGTRLKPIDAIIKNSRSVPVAHTSLLTYYSLNYYSQGNQKHILITQNPLSVETLRFIGGQKQEVDPKSDRLWLVDTEKWTDTKDREANLKKVFSTYHVEKTYKVDRISVKLLKRK